MSMSVTCGFALWLNGVLLLHVHYVHDLVFCLEAAAPRMAGKAFLSAAFPAAALMIQEAPSGCFQVLVSLYNASNVVLGSRFAFEWAEATPRGGRGKSQSSWSSQPTPDCSSSVTEYLIFVVLFSGRCVRVQANWEMRDLERLMWEVSEIPKQCFYLTNNGTRLESEGDLRSVGPESRVLMKRRLAGGARPVIPGEWKCAVCSDAGPHGRLATGVAHNDPRQPLLNQIPLSMGTKELS